MVIRLGIYYSYKGILNGMRTVGDNYRADPSQGDCKRGRRISASVLTNINRLMNVGACS